MSGSWIGTYRLQLHAGFPLDAAQRILPYLAELGMSHVYLSPCLQAVPGSQHGYDVTDPTRISEDLGGEPAWARFVAGAQSAGLCILLDIVPNHMSATARNPWWDDVLAHGPFSEFAGFFDIRSEPNRPFLVHLCTLARPYGEAIEAGELTIDIQGGRPRIRHYENNWPLGPASWGALLSANPLQEPCFAELERLRMCAESGERERALYAQHRNRAEEILRAAEHSGQLKAAVLRIQGDQESLDVLLQRQFYQLHGWKLAGELCNYRRFFDVDSLVGMRMGQPKVIAATHVRIEKMISRGEIDGVRVDHPDGLRDPRTYCQRLRDQLPDGRIYVEKILENDERLKEEWPGDATAGD